MSLPSGDCRFHSIRQNVGPSVSNRTSAGRRCYRPTRFPNLIDLRLAKTPARGLLKTPPTRALSLGLTSPKVFPTSGDAHITTPAKGRMPDSRSPTPRAARAHDSGTYVPRPIGLRPGLREPGARPLGTLFRLFVPSQGLPGRRHFRVRPPLQGGHHDSLHDARFLEGCLDVDCFTPTPNHSQPVNYIAQHPLTVKYGPARSPNLHRQWPFLSMSLFEPRSDNPGAHHANPASTCRSPSRTAPGRAHCTRAAWPAWDALRPTGRS